MPESEMQVYNFDCQLFKCLSIVWSDVFRLRGARKVSPENGPRKESNGHFEVTFSLHRRRNETGMGDCTYILDGQEEWRPAGCFAPPQERSAPKF